MSSSSSPEPLLLNLKQAAVFLGLPATTLSQWAWQGSHGLTVVRIGHSRLFRRRDLIDWVDAHACPPKAKHYSLTDGRRKRYSKDGRLFEAKEGG